MRHLASKMMTKVSFHHDEVIFRTGDPSQCAYMIESGQVEVFAGNPAEPVPIALLGAGEILGEGALIEERPRSLNARAVGTVGLSAVSRDQFVKLMFKDPVEGLVILRAFFERLRTFGSRTGRNDAVGAPPAAATSRANRITLMPLTEMARQVLPTEGRVIDRYPFRIGREPLLGKSRLSMNDLGLPDIEPFNVSREHFAIDRDGDSLMVVDRGSFLGTIVNGEQIGGHRTAGSAPLRSGSNEIIAGVHDSPYGFSAVLDTT